MRDDTNRNLVSGAAFNLVVLDEIQRIKNDVAIHLIEEWLADELGYDETVWETVKAAIEDNKLSERRRFDE